MQLQNGYNPLQRIQDFANTVEKPGRVPKDGGVPKTKRVRYNKLTLFKLSPVIKNEFKLKIFV